MVERTQESRQVVKKLFSLIGSMKLSSGLDANRTYKAQNWEVRPLR